MVLEKARRNESSSKIMDFKSFYRIRVEIT